MWVKRERKIYYGRINMKEEMKRAEEFCISIETEMNLIVCQEIFFSLLKEVKKNKMARKGRKDIGKYRRPPFPVQEKKKKLTDYS